MPTSLTGYDLIITSYGTLIRDKEIFENLPLLCVIGDEAQYLKNRKTQNAQAISALVSEGRILLTGTPIENNVYDLISLLEFLLPGSRPEIPGKFSWRRENLARTKNFKRGCSLFVAEKKIGCCPFRNFQRKLNKSFMYSSQKNRRKYIRKLEYHRNQNLIN